MDQAKKRSKQHSFDCYCKKALRNAISDIHAENARRKHKELLFSELSHTELNQLSKQDVYFCDEWIFEVLGASVTVHHELLAQCLQRLSEFRRNIIILSYFLDLPDRKIAELLGSKRANIHYHRSTALKQLKNYLSEIGGEYPYE